MKQTQLILLFLVSMISSCCKFSICENVDCGKFGNCDEADGKCICEAGFEWGTDNKCNVATRSKFLGNWRAFENCSPMIEGDYMLTISPSLTDSNTIVLTNFGGISCETIPLDVFVEVQDSTLIHFREECSTVKISACSGKISRNRKNLTLSYTIKDGWGYINFCTANLTKQ